MNQEGNYFLKDIDENYKHESLLVSVQLRLSYQSFFSRQRASSFLRLRLHGTGPEPFRTEPDRIGFCLHGTVWNRSRCLHGTFLEPVRIGSDTGPAKQQIQFWIRSGSVPDRSRVNIASDPSASGNVQIL